MYGPDMDTAMEKRWKFPSSGASTSTVSSQQTSRRPAQRLCSLLGLIILMCVIAILFNVWIIEEYIVGTSTHVPLTIPTISHNIDIDISNKTEDFHPARLMVYASGDKYITNTNVSVPKPKPPPIGEPCEVPRFDPQSKHPGHVTCRRRKPMEGSCKQAKDLYLSQPKLTCDEPTVTICQLQRNSRDFYIRCNNDICKSDIQLGFTDPQNGTLVTWKAMPTITILETAITSLLKTNASGGNLGFCFISCVPFDPKLANGVEGTKRSKSLTNQILLLPQYFTPYKCRNKTFQDAINVNLIWLDSCSHSHFYRSLPKSVSALKTASTNNASHVFNYNLMQSMAGGTFQNMMALTRGVKTPGKKDKSRGNNLYGIGNLFHAYQEGGYYTTYVDDLSFRAQLSNRIMGIPKLMGLPLNRTFVASWIELLRGLSAKGIDQIGIALANSEMMSGQQNMFLEATFASKCYNGRFYTDYILEYMELLQSQLQLANRPYYNHIDLNTCHEPSGRRCQTLDNSLSKFITHISKQKNTITFMFGDHGLKYGKSLRKTREAYVEAAHPVNFIIASKDVDVKLGQDRMDALRINQDRLIDIIDIRQTLYTLAPVKFENSFLIEDAYDAHPNGLFIPINPVRSCDNLGIQLEQHKCICDIGPTEASKPNGTRENVLAEFALGQINNMIQEQFMDANRNRTRGFGLCQRLVGKWIENLQVRVYENFTETEMLIHLPAGVFAPQTEDLFDVTVQVANANATYKPAMKLVHYLRISSHGVYDECRDDGVARDLCICSPSDHTKSPAQLSGRRVSKQLKQLNEEQNKRRTGPWHLDHQVSFGTLTVVLSLNRHVFIYERRTSGGVVLEASCDTEGNVVSTYELVIQIVSNKNVLSSKESPSAFVIRPGMKIFLDVFYPHDPFKKWELKYEVSYRQLS